MITQDLKNGWIISCYNQKYYALGIGYGKIGVYRASLSHHYKIKDNLIDFEYDDQKPLPLDVRQFIVKYLKYFNMRAFC